MERNDPSRRRVFLCHNSDDKLEVRQLREQLQGRDIEVWMDEYDLPPGTDWVARLEREIELGIPAAVCMGQSGIGPWQMHEYRAFLRENTERELPVIPVLLRSCDAKPDLPLFLKGRSWVDFRPSAVDPGVQPALDHLIYGITGARQERTDASTVFVAVCSGDPVLRRLRRDLITYCRNAGIGVLGEKEYAPSNIDQLRDDLHQCDLFVQLLNEFPHHSADVPHGRDVWFFEIAKSIIKKEERLIRWRRQDCDFALVEIDRHRDLLAHPDVFFGTPAQLHKLVSVRARRAHKVGPVEACDDMLLAMVKYNQSNVEPTRALVECLTEQSVLCRQYSNGGSLTDVFREMRYDAVIVVRENGPDDWLDDLANQMLQLELTLRDQTPVQVYYQSQRQESVPPYSSLNVMEVFDTSDVPQIVRQMRLRKRG